MHRKLRQPLFLQDNGLAVAWNIEVHDTVLSTQDIALGMGRLGQPEGAVVQAYEQTGGRGRHGRSWVSEKGNLYLSVLLRPSCHVQKAGQISILLSLALAETILPHLVDSKALVLKWPNDILLAGKKCAGILIETELSEGGSLDFAVLGLGVNIIAAPEEGACLNEHAKAPVDLMKFRGEFLKNLNKYYGLWSRSGFAEIKESWLKLAHKRGADLRIKVGAQVETGKFFSIDDEGNLLLQDSAFRQKKVTAGEVWLIKAP